MHGGRAAEIEGRERNPPEILRRTIEEPSKNHRSSIETSRSHHAHITLTSRSHHAHITLTSRSHHASSRLSGGWQCRGWRGLGHGRREEADAKVPAWLINRAQPRIAGTNFPDEPNLVVRQSNWRGRWLTDRKSI